MSLLLQGMKGLGTLVVANAPTQRNLANAAAQADSWWMIGLYVLFAVAAIIAFISVLSMALIYLERKAAGHFQFRTGPMRVGPHGLFQTVADVLKLFFKEDVLPDRADKLVHFLGPVATFSASLVAILVIPFSSAWQVIDINIGVLFLAAVSSFGVFGLLMAGWASNNKWSLMGAIRAGAQLISYELSTALALLVVVLMAGSLQFGHIVESQADGWWLFKGHLPALIAFIIFLIAGTAELNRVPFDIAEGESELTGGYHTEYSGMRWAMFFLAEFINMFTIAAVGATLFLGGWQPPHEMLAFIPGIIWFTLKVSLIIFTFMWFRWTFPRLRVDQLMHLEWKVLLPIGLVNVLIAAAMQLGSIEVPGYIAQWMQFGLTGLFGLYMFWCLIPHSLRGRGKEVLKPF
jgi:NADH-quinone oxidoreductase subunit H